jgi:hypothetical protein
VRPQRARHRPKTPFWGESGDPVQTPPGGAWRGRLSGRALSSKPFPLGGGWVRAGAPRKRGAALRNSARWSPHGEQENSHFRVKAPPCAAPPLPRCTPPAVCSPCSGMCAGMDEEGGSSKRRSGGGEGAASAPKRSKAGGEQECAVCLAKLTNAAGKWVNDDVAEAEGCAHPYCTGCLLEGIAHALPGKFACASQGCGRTVTSWVRFKAAVRRSAAGGDVRNGVQGAVAGGLPWRWWVMPNAFLDYFTATPEQRQLSSVIAVAYPRAEDPDVQFLAAQLRSDADEQPLSEGERLSRGTLLDTLGVQLHHGVVARDERVVRSGADSCVLGMDDLEPRVQEETMTQRFLRVGLLYK